MCGCIPQDLLQILRHGDHHAVQQPLCVPLKTLACRSEPQEEGSASLAMPLTQMIVRSVWILVRRCRRS